MAPAERLISAVCRMGRCAAPGISWKENAASPIPTVPGRGWVYAQPAMGEILTRLNTLFVSMQPARTSILQLLLIN